MICILAHGGASSRDDPEGGAGSGVLRPRLVSAGSGGPGHRPPGMTTWLRGARCTDPEGMPEMEARPPAENRHGGAPRGERPASWGAPHPAGGADLSRLTNATTEIVRLSALRPPLHWGMDAITRTPPGRTTRRGNEEGCVDASVRCRRGELCRADQDQAQDPRVGRAAADRGRAAPRRGAAVRGPRRPGAVARVRAQSLRTPAPLRWRRRSMRRT